MHNAALRQLALPWRYQFLPIPPELFADAVRALPALGFRGINVTIPHKEAALALADQASDTAARVGAANTLTFEAGGIHADNTDVTGLLALLGDVRGHTALVLGAGGAGRAAVHALVHGGAEVMVWNRTSERAERVATELGGRPVTGPVSADIVINTTSVGLHGEEDPFKALPISADTFNAGSTVADMVYRAGGTPFIAAARSRGARVVDGLEILVAQGAASFERWTGRPAPHEVMREAVKDTPTR
jgi:shikimate dehydrogenase